MRSGLSAIGGATAILYLLNAVLRWIQGPTPEGTVGSVATWFVLIAVSLLYALGFSMVQRTPSDPRHAKAAGVFAAAFGLIAFATPPWDSADVHVYAAAGWEQSHYGLNPYTHTFREIPGYESDPMISHAWMARNRNPWPDLPFVYGPLFALQCRAVAWLAEGDLWTTVFLFKAVNLLTAVALAWLLWSFAAQTGAPPAVALYLFAWNPMILLQHIGNAHNDLIVGALIAGCAALALRKRFLWMLPALMAAALIKYVALGLAPFALLYIWRIGGLRKALLSTLAAAVLAGAAFVPYLRDGRPFRLDAWLLQISETTGSAHAFLVRVAVLVAPDANLAALATLLQYSGAVALVVFFVWRVLRFAQIPDPAVADLVRESAWMMLAILFASSKFWGWYLGMALPVSLLAGATSPVSVLTVALSVGHLAEMTGLRRKAIGYFAVTTLAPIVAISRRRYQGVNRSRFL